MARPTDGFLTWNPTKSNVSIPPAGNKTSGAVEGQRFPAKWFNWLLNLSDQWIQYLDEAVSATVLVANSAQSGVDTIRTPWNETLTVDITGTPDVLLTGIGGTLSFGSGNVNTLSIKKIGYTVFMHFRISKLTTSAPCTIGINFDGSLTKLVPDASLIDAILGVGSFYQNKATVISKYTPGYVYHMQIINEYDQSLPQLTDRPLSFTLVYQSLNATE